MYYIIEISLSFLSLAALFAAVEYRIGQIRQYRLLLPRLLELGVVHPIAAYDSGVHRLGEVEVGRDSRAGGTGGLTPLLVRGACPGVLALVEQILLCIGPWIRLVLIHVFVRVLQGSLGRRPTLVHDVHGQPTLARELAAARLLILSAQVPLLLDGSHDPPLPQLTDNAFP